MEQTTDPVDKSTDNTINPEQEKKTHPVMEISEINNEETEHSQAQIKNQPQVPKKKIKTYLFEFLMLFLAVFCGFLADNLRVNAQNRR